MDTLNFWWQYTWVNIPGIWKPEALLITNDLAKDGKLVMKKQNKQA